MIPSKGLKPYKTYPKKSDSLSSSNDSPLINSRDKELKEWESHQRKVIREEYLTIR